MDNRRGYPDLIAKSADHYVELALRLACEPDYRAAVTQQIAQRSDVLFDDQAVVDEYSRFLGNVLDGTESGTKL